MCGIVGYIGKNNAATEVVKGLKSVEYRGYDSAGLAYLDAKGSISLIKRKGKVASLEAAVTEQNCASSAAIGHTRWATHGKVCEENSHPFLSYNGAFAVAHNGIIENYCELKAELLAGGAVFASETDSEVITHLIEK
ncbi:MAG: class II glutamine amidotransferase, partial [Christensenellaceae bacterium]|nr:class II glutamine amidotransferase [Christensenellaceae bacterium]